MSSPIPDVLRCLRLLERCGLMALPEPAAAAPAAAPTELAPEPAPAPVSEPVPELAPPPAPARAIAVEAGNVVEEAPVARVAVSKKAAALAEVAAEIAVCRKCGLCTGRTKTVPGEGNPDAKLVFIGEAPGAEEDKQGRPFVGRAGELLTQMITAMKFSREDVFIANVVKCRPPGNRIPTPQEAAACEGHLLRQLDIIEPKIIVTLGACATHLILNTTTAISKLRGIWSEFHGIRVMPTFHPAYLLRSPAEKRKCWEDLQKVMAEYERMVGPLPRK